MVATPVLRCDSESLGHFFADRAAGRVGATTVVTSRSGDALYFSKEVIPFTNGRTHFDEPVPVFHHVGLYAYRPAALAAYARWHPTLLEELEGLEQLRFLEAGWRIRAVEVDARGRPFWEVNNPEDVDRVEGQLAALGVP
jgi:3-deoxy-manno-octulosonate cytidylyltransferase (CMP-KDO synthetase)